MQGMHSSKQEEQGQVYKEDTLGRTCPRAGGGPWGQTHGCSAWAPGGAAGWVTSPSTVTFSILEPEGVRCLQPERGHHPGEGGVWWSLLCHLQSSRVPHGKGKGWGGGCEELHLQRTAVGEGRKCQPPGPPGHPRLVLSLSLAPSWKDQTPFLPFGVHVTSGGTFFFF